MIPKVPSLKLSGRIFVRTPLSAYISSISGASYIQTNPQDDQFPPNSSEFELKVQSLKNKLHPETLIHVLSSTHDLNSSLRLFKWASLQNRFRHTTDTYSHIIMRLGIASRVDEMEGFCNEMVKCGFSASDQALLGLLDSFIRYHRLDEALRVFFVLNSSSYKLSISLVNRLLGVLVKEKKGLKSVLFVYKEMVKVGIFPATETLNYLLEALFDAGQIDAVLDQYKRIRKKGCCPNSRTFEIMERWIVDSSCYATLIESLCQLDKIQEAFEVFRYMSFNKCSLCSSSISMLIRGLCLIGKIDKAIHLPSLAYYSGKSCSTSDYGITIKTLSKLSKSNGLLVIFARMVVEGCPLDSESYNELIKSTSENCQATECGLFLNLLVNEGFVPDTETLHSSVSCLAQDSRLHTVLPAINKLFFNHEVVNPAICNILINGVWKEGYKHEARWLLDVMLGNGWVPDATTHRLLVNSGGGGENGNTDDEIMNILSEGFSEL